MMHGGSGAHGGAGIEGMTPPLGTVTSAVSLGGFLGALWIIVAYPKSALACVIGASGAAFALEPSGVTATSPFVLLVCAVIGCMCGGESGKPSKRRQLKLDARMSTQPVRPRVRTTDPMIQLRKDYLS